MFTQLSLFDSLGSHDSAVTFEPIARQTPVAIPQSAEVTAHEARQNALRTEADRLEAARIAAACQRKTDEVRPMGDLAQLVLARYDLMIRRREERERRRREQPRQSIRVLSPAVG
jgi:hypothetical protein